MLGLPDLSDATHRRERALIPFNDLAMTSLTTAPPVHSYITPQTILSNLFRFASWIHLRWSVSSHCNTSRFCCPDFLFPDSAPTNPQAHIFLLTLYGAASILLFSESAPDDSPIPAVKVVAEANGVEKGNGHVVIEPVEIQRRGVSLFF